MEKHCEWCGESYDITELYHTDLGFICETCISAVQSRGEEVVVLEE